MSTDAAGIALIVSGVIAFTGFCIRQEMRDQSALLHAKLDSIYQRLHGIDNRGHRGDMRNED